MSPSASSPKSRGRALAAASLVLPLLCIPAAPALAAGGAIASVDARGPFGAASGYGSYGGYGGSGGSGGSGGFGWFGGPGYGDGGQTTTARDTTQNATAASAAQSTGVVLIETVVDYGEGEAAGTGLVIGSDGTVVTNHHVIAGATSISVTVPSTGRKYTATVVGYNATRDVAVLKLADASGLATVATDTTVSVGESVTAVGNAEGADALTAAAGTILRRRAAIDVTEDDGTSAHLTGLIENNADVVAGDSGGALLDSDDEVVAMTVAASSGSVNVTGYAIPIARVMRIASSIEAGQASKAITIGSRAALGIELDTRTSTAYVAGVVDGGAAAAAGIAAGDTITSLHGRTITSADALTTAVGALRPGQHASVGWTDATGAHHIGTVTLGTAPVA